jgi:hypothetical protein
LRAQRRGLCRRHFFLKVIQESFVVTTQKSSSINLFLPGCRIFFNQKALTIIVAGEGFLPFRREILA